MGKSADFSHSKVIALAGNPNVGKSTLFNNLTGLRQHTGNWPGKTVELAQGHLKGSNSSFTLVDLPGTYSLLAHSPEEEVARNFICFGKPDGAVVVCDATCLERSLNLALQVMEICPNTIVCVNLLDEAKRRGISVDLKKLEENLGVPVVGTSAHQKSTLKKLVEKLEELCQGKISTTPRQLRYIKPVEEAVSIVKPVAEKLIGKEISSRWLALRLIDGDETFLSELRERSDILEKAKRSLAMADITTDILKDRIVSCILLNAEEACFGVLNKKSTTESSADRILTSKAFGYPIMILSLLVIFWLTIVGSNYPSEWLSAGLFWLGDRLRDLFDVLNSPWWFTGVVVDGAYRVLAWVVSVMLPPMAIFFPLFTLLEDLGYLPRIAYNLDKPFCKCKACGKQALTMAMGFGCNAAGITGCRIIDSPRERLIAMLTNVFVPCNGRFPMIITIITLFFLGGKSGAGEGFLSALILTAVVLLGVGMTFLVSKILSATLLKGEPSSFTLELPPFRKPQIGKILVRSLLDRTVFVLGRAAAVAAPAGAIIWILANIAPGGEPLLSYVTAFLDPFGELIGLDGVILTAFLLGIPANEIVIPLAVMMYSGGGSIAEIAPAQMFELFSANGWSTVTAICVIVFTLMHFPCSTSLLTIKKEADGISSKSGLKWAVTAFIIPTVCGILLCGAVKFVAFAIGI